MVVNWVTITFLMFLIYYRSFGDYKVLSKNSPGLFLSELVSFRPMASYEREKNFSPGHIALLRHAANVS